MYISNLKLATVFPYKVGGELRFFGFLGRVKSEYFQKFLRHFYKLEENERKNFIYDVKI